MARATETKRKEPEQDEDHKTTFAEAVRLEMLSDEEKRDEEEGESDEEVDEFPEIDAESDSGSDDESDEKDEGEDDEGNSPSGSESDGSSDMHTFPKNVISEITGQPKRVYPEIEPEYDSDSSTEDVRVQFPIPLELFINV